LTSLLFVFFQELDLAKNHNDPTNLDGVGQYLLQFSRLSGINKRIKMHFQCFNWFSMAKFVQSQIDLLTAAFGVFNDCEDGLKSLLSM